MITEAIYLQQLQSCASFNKRLNEHRRRPYPFFDQQNGIAQGPTTHLFKRATDRCPTKSPFEVVRYKAQKWKGNITDNAALEFQYIIGTDPTLRAAVENITNPHQSNDTSFQNETLDDSFVSKYSNHGRTNYVESLDYEDNEQDDLDLSDEDEWGDKRRKRRRGGGGGGGHKDASFKGPSSGRRGGMANINPGSSGIDERPFECQDCGARYKSRPGLTYHKIHVHEKNKQQNMTPL